MFRKYYAIRCDVKGCQFITVTPMRTKVGARQKAADGGWQIYRDARKRERARCPAHRKAE